MYPFANPQRPIAKLFFLVLIRKSLTFPMANPYTPKISSASMLSLRNFLQRPAATSMGERCNPKVYLDIPNEA
ncbi:hypothetical protein [Shewanella gelidii]|uniref:Uncharacterized protein n=1 Tax=Shewanella gelidii TaxID=1642821 RepID=A0A917JLK0_9GAMM|nr:hypothetical protein [Shewanella gelidii]GGI76289.1 hypothetical protein GCM10009332_12060 [Shewanella gelidii]